MGTLRIENGIFNFQKIDDISTLLHSEINTYVYHDSNDGKIFLIHDRNKERYIVALCLNKYNELFINDINCKYADFLKRKNAIYFPKECKCEKCEERDFDFGNLATFTLTEKIEFPKEKRLSDYCSVM